MEDGKPSRKSRVEGRGQNNLTRDLPFSSSSSSIVLGFRLSRTIKPAFDPVFGLGGRAIGADAVLDGDAAALILAERRVNQAMVVAHMAVNNGEVFFLDGAGLPDFAEFTGGFGIFGDENDAAGFAVEAVDQMG